MLVRVNVGVIAMKDYSTDSEAHGLEPHHQMLFSVISKILVKRVLLPMQGFYQCILQHKFTRWTAFQSFPSPRLVASPKPKNPVRPTIYP